jgi:cbb3-type cytochrome oxidase maturation protein
MDALFVLLPLALLVAAVAVGFFIWAARSGQFDDLDTPPVRILFDDELRYRISRAIYGNGGFSHYAAMVNPPIHIVVENGRVTLTGVVNSNVERMMAQALASSFDAFQVVNQLKTDAEVKAELEKL